MTFRYQPPVIVKALASEAPNQTNSGIYSAFKLADSTRKNIVAWAKRAGIAKHIEDPRSFHVTTVYSREPFDYDCLGVCPLKARFFGYDVFGDKSASTLVALIASPFLHKLFHMRKTAGMLYDYESYKPHVSIGKGFAKEDIDDLPPMDFPCLLTEEFFEPLDDDKAAKVSKKPDEKDTLEKAEARATERITAFLIASERKQANLSHARTRPRVRERYQIGC